MTENNASQFVIYQSEDGQTKLDVRFVGETVWLTQALMAALFQTSTDNISLHLKNIYAEGELDEISTTEDFSVVRQEGTRQINRKLKHYNLDAVISVGYLKENELLALNNLIEQYLVFAEGQAMRRIPMTMGDWMSKLDGFLSLNDRDILDHAGKVSHLMAKEMAELEYNTFNQLRLQQETAETGKDLEQLAQTAEQIAALN